jgi:hypothetical protein
MNPRTIPVAFVALWLVACGKEAGRVPFAAEGTANATATLNSGNVDFWTDIDMKWEGDAALAYTIELEQGGKSVATATCNPLGPMNVKVGWSETNIGGSHSRSGSGKMGCSATLPSGGATNVKATLAFSRKPATLTLSKADLVVKQ